MYCTCSGGKKTRSDSCILSTRPGLRLSTFRLEQIPNAKAECLAIPIFPPLSLMQWSRAGLRTSLGLAGALDLPGFRAVDVV